MSAEVLKKIEFAEELVERIRDASRYPQRLERKAELEKQMNREGFWDEPDAANAVIRELKIHKDIVDAIDALAAGLSDARTLRELAQEEADEASLKEVEEEVDRLAADASALELKTLLSGDHDAASCYLSIHPGAGGTDSCDWAAMLKRMFLRYAERNQFKVKILEELPGEETGIKSITMHISGFYSYGYLRAEMGVHRLVRISPFDAKNRRHTSFASVDVSPEIEDVAVEIEESDLRIDTYRSSGAGGQHVNTTDSAVRITHLPTGIVVQCQNERSQHTNRAAAMQVLASRLAQLEEQKRQEELAAITGEKGEIAFGSQIRSYVLHPYKMVKDHRTNVETGNVDAVLDGDLNALIEAFLRHSAKSTRRS